MLRLPLISTNHPHCFTIDNAALLCVSSCPLWLILKIDDPALKCRKTFWAEDIVPGTRLADHAARSCGPGGRQRHRQNHVAESPCRPRVAGLWRYHAAARHPVRLPPAGWAFTFRPHRLRRMSFGLRVRTPDAARTGRACASHGGG